jgi:hypothetical protein
VLGVDNIGVLRISNDDIKKGGMKFVRTNSSLEGQGPPFPSPV